MVRVAKRYQLEDHGTSRAMDEVREVVNDLAATSLLSGVLLEDIELSGGVTRKLAHGLGRAPRGWMVVRQKGWTSTGYLNEVDHGKKNEQLWLKAIGMDPTLSLWVF